MPKTIMNCRDQSDQVQSMTKTIEDNDMTDRTDVIYAKYDTELS